MLFRGVVTDILKIGFDHGFLDLTMKYYLAVELSEFLFYVCNWVSSDYLISGLQFEATFPDRSAVEIQYREVQGDQCKSDEKI